MPPMRTSTSGPQPSDKVLHNGRCLLNNELSISVIFAEVPVVLARSTPQQLTGRSRRLAARTTSRTSFRTAGCEGAKRSATRSFVRSTARVYWTRSLVPMEKKSASWANTEACNAADGTSIIMPTGISEAYSMACSSRSSITSARIILA